MVGLLPMLQTLVIAAFKAGIPVGLASYGLIWWALKKDYLKSIVSVKELEQELKRQSKDKQSRKKSDPVHNKWLAFGGGFYGVVGFMTYIVVELGEIRDFFVQFEGVGAFISGISIDMFIGLFIDALMNFVVAIAWPAYWIADIEGGHIWIWFLVAYGGYWAGTRLALRRLVEQGENTDN